MKNWKPSWVLATILIAAAIIILAVWLTSSPVSAFESPTYVGQARVIDGDTIQIRGQSIRLQGIDAPERRWPSGKSAAIFLENLIAGDDVSCFTTETDRYGRRIGDCTVRGAALDIDLEGGTVTVGDTTPPTLVDWSSPTAPTRRPSRRRSSSKKHC